MWSNAPIVPPVHAPAPQRSLDDMGAPLSDVTFCVIDLETTGGSPEHSRITEIGAVTYRGGERLGTLQTFVNPQCEIPPAITVLTGITQSMVVGAPTIDELLPTLLEFIGDAVVVAHNARFDVGFINAALVRDDRDELANQVLDTVPLARRLLRGQVPDCKLGTLATRLRLAHRPCHRALDDALATGDLLHFLIERASGYGVTGLDDLAMLTRLDQHPQAAKLRLTERLPRLPGVYLFVGDGGTVLYVGKSTNIRARVRSYFGTGETRRKVHAMLRQVRDVRYIATPDPLTAEVYESRLIARLLPQYNRTGTRADSYRYLRLANERGRLRAVNTRKTGGDGAYLGPISSRRMAESVADAVASVLPRFDESSDPSADVDAALAALADDPGSIAAAIERRMTALSAEQRFEDAALARDRLRAFVLTVSRRQLADQLRAAGRLHVESGGVHYLLDHGVLTSVRRDGELFSPSATSTAGDDLLALVNPPEPPCDLSLPPPTACFDELLLVARHLGAHGAVVHSATGDWSSRLESSRRALLAEVPNGWD